MMQYYEIDEGHQLWDLFKKSYEITNIPVSFNVGNAIKYIVRYNRKHVGLEYVDLSKAKAYIQQLAETKEDACITDDNFKRVIQNSELLNTFQKVTIFAVINGKYEHALSLISEQLKLLSETVTPC